MTPPITPTTPSTAATKPQAQSRSRPGTDYILEALAAEGLGHLFMVPGGLVDPFLPALARQSALKPIVAAHEGGAVYMADGYARASGRFGAALGIGGPGACNMATAVAAAKTDGSPVLVMTGEVPLDMEGRGFFQDASQATLEDTAVLRSLTRMSKAVETAKNLNHWFRHALTAMCEQPRGPAHLSLMHDSLVGETSADYVKVFDLFTDAEPLSRAAADRALGALADVAAGRTRIAVLAGAGVEHDAAAARLKALAERWSIPVATTLRAKGVFPEDHPLSLGVFGYAGTRSRHASHSRRRARLPDRARLRPQRARHDALDAARPHQGADDPRQHRHGRAQRPRRSRSCRGGKLPRLPRAGGGARAGPGACAATGRGGPPRLAGGDQVEAVGNE